MYTDLADKAVRMPLGVERRDVVLHDGFITPAAFRREHVKVVSAAIRLAIPFVEAIFTELLTTLSTEKVLRMPSFFQSRHAFLQKKTT